MSARQSDLFAGGQRLIYDDAVEMTLASKICVRCKELRPHDEFNKSSRERDGLRPECKICRRDERARCRDKRSASRRSTYAANKDRARKQSRAYYGRNAEKLAKAERDRRAKHTPQQKAAAVAGRKRWQERNREKYAADQARWRKEHRAEQRLKQSAYRQENIEARRAYERDRRLSNPEWDKAKKHTRRARLRAANGSFTAAQWRELCTRFGDVCLACGRGGKLTADHIVPLAESGSGGISNIQPLCASCNGRKGTKTIDYRPTCTGTEPRADVPLDAVFADGTVQPLLIGAE